MEKDPHSPEQRQLQAMLRSARQGVGKSQTQVALQLGKPQSFVAKYESGERRLDVIELLYVLKAIGVDPTGFIEELSQHVKI